LALYQRRRYHNLGRCGFTDIDVCVDSKPNMLRAQAEPCETWTNPNVAAKGAAHFSTRPGYCYGVTRVCEHG
jgi:hypothetical protein